MTSITVDSTRTLLVRVDNPLPDAEFGEITMRSGGTRPIRRDHRPSADDRSRAMRSLVVVRGVPSPPIAGDKLRHLAFCRTHLAVPSA